MSRMELYVNSYYIWTVTCLSCPANLPPSVPKTSLQALCFACWGVFPRAPAVIVPILLVIPTLALYQCCLTNLGGYKSFQLVVKMSRKTGFTFGPSPVVSWWILETRWSNGAGEFYAATFIVWPRRLGSKLAIPAIAWLICFDQKLPGPCEDWRGTVLFLSLLMGKKSRAFVHETGRRCEQRRL